MHTLRQCLYQLKREFGDLFDWERRIFLLHLGQRATGPLLGAKSWGRG